jgi:hypothetical protein
VRKNRVKEDRVGDHDEREDRPQRITGTGQEATIAPQAREQSGNCRVDREQQREN